MESICSNKSQAACPPGATYDAISEYTDNLEAHAPLTRGLPALSACKGWKEQLSTFRESGAPVLAAV